SDGSQFSIRGWSDQGTGWPYPGSRERHFFISHARSPWTTHPFSRFFYAPGGTHMVAIRSRSSWGARAPRSRNTTSWGSRDEVTLHYSYGPESQTVRSIQDHHMDGNGWADIGYNFLVDH